MTHAICMIKGQAYIELKKAPLGPSTVKELRSCVEVEVAVPGTPSLTVLMVSVDVKQD